MVELVEAYGAFMAGSDIPKLFINADPGSIWSANNAILPQLAEPARGHRQRPALFAGRLPERDWSGDCDLARAL